MRLRDYIIKHPVVIRLSYAFLLILFPMAAFAQTPAGFPPDLWVFLQRLGFVLTSLTALVTALALLFFVYGLVRFIANAGDEEKRKQGKKAMLWSLIAIFIMMSLWGIVAILQSVFGIDTSLQFEPPCLDNDFFGAQAGC